MSEIHCLDDEPVSEFLNRIDWSFVKRVTITKTVDGKFWVELTHYRSGRFMHHAFKHGRVDRTAAKDGVIE